MAGVLPQLLHQAVFPLEIGLHGLGGVVGALIGPAIDVVGGVGGAREAGFQGVAGGDPGGGPARQDQGVVSGQRRKFRRRL